VSDAGVLGTQYLLYEFRSVKEFFIVQLSCIFLAKDLLHTSNTGLITSYFSDAWKKVLLKLQLYHTALGVRVTYGTEP
jgi:hypothetical protein